MVFRILRKIESFDLARLNLVGWTVFFVCIALVGFAIFLIINTPLDIGKGHGFWHEVKVHAESYGMLVLAALVFVGARIVLSLLGISVYRKGRRHF
jgi:hypothetical protein